MKILLINSVYGKGSTGLITESLYKGYKDLGNDVKVIYGRHSNVLNNPNIFKLTLEFESKIHHLFSKFTGNLYGGMYLSTKKIIRFIKKDKPDLIHLHCLNGYFVNIYKFLKFLAKNNFKVILTMHADFMMTGGCGIADECSNYLSNECKKCKYTKIFNSKYSLNRTHYFYLKLKKAISLFNDKNLRVTCVSPWLAKRYKESPIFKDKLVSSVLNPVDDTYFKKPTTNPYKTKNNVLFVTPDINDYIKGTFYLIKIARECPNLNFTVICSKTMPFNFEEKNIQYISGGVPKEILRNYYCFSDVTLILSKRETYSMVVAESLVCGTPVVGFKCGGPESVNFSNDAIFIDYGNVDKIAKYLISYKKPKTVFINHDLSYGSIAKVYLSLFQTKKQYR